MKEDNISDVFVWGPVILVVVALCVLSTCMGCSSTCPPPKTQTVEVKVPVYSCPPPPEVHPLELPDFPPVPHEDVSSSEVKAWYAQVVSVVKQREHLLESRVEALQEILDQYKKDQPTP